MPGLCSCKSWCQSNTKFPFKTVYFLGVWGLSSSSYIVYDLTTSGHMDLESIHVLCIEFIYISSSSSSLLIGRWPVYSSASLHLFISRPRLVSTYNSEYMGILRIGSQAILTQYACVLKLKLQQQVEISFLQKYVTAIISLS